MKFKFKYFQFFILRGMFKKITKQFFLKTYGKYNSITKLFMATKAERTNNSQLKIDSCIFVSTCTKTSIKFSIYELLIYSSWDLNIQTKHVILLNNLYKTINLFLKCNQLSKIFVKDITNSHKKWTRQESFGKHTLAHINIRNAVTMDTSE